MAQNQFIHGNVAIPIPSHICMLDGPDYINDSAAAELKQLKDENSKLKAALLEHGFSWDEVPSRPVKQQNRSAPSSLNCGPLPQMPLEIQFKILSQVMQHSRPIIDPFVRRRKEHLTKLESETAPIHVQFLEVSKAYQAEATRVFFAQNSFVFTQVAALQRYASYPVELRATARHVVLRVVGRYYDNEAHRQHIFNNTYHPDTRNYKLPIFSRSAGAEMDKGIHAYCWQQVADFLKAMRTPNGSELCKVFPSLQSMRLDLINFCDSLPYPGSSFATVVRWHAGRLVDELIVTGLPHDDLEYGPEVLLGSLIKDEGVYGIASPSFVSGPRYLKPLKPIELYTKVIRACTCKQNCDANTNGPHPEGGMPPVSKHPAGRTIWKYVLYSLACPDREWVEFDRHIGGPVDDMGYGDFDLSGDDEDSDDDFYIPNMGSMFAI